MSRFRRGLDWWYRQTRKEQIDIIIAVVCLTAIAAWATWWVASLF